MQHSYKPISAAAYPTLKEEEQDRYTLKQNEAEIENLGDKN